MRDEQASIYGRLCAAYFLLNQDDEEARLFVLSQLESSNLRHRHNAAETVRWHVRNNPQKRWGVQTLVQLLKSGAIDGPPFDDAIDLTEFDPGKFPEEDWHDILHSPITQICWDLGYMKEQSAIPALISVLERRPANSGAAMALGDIGDQRAAPALMKVLLNRTGDSNCNEITALGQLKYQQAVPALIQRLNQPVFLA